MSSILSVTVPFFALVLCGYLAARFRLLPESAIPGLNIYVLFFALPCMLYRFGSSLPVAQLIDGWVIALWSTVALLMVFGTIVLTRSPRLGLKDAAFGALTATFPAGTLTGAPKIRAAQLLREQPGRGGRQGHPVGRLLGPLQRAQHRPGGGNGGVRYCSTREGL